MKSQNIFVALILIILVGAAAFFGGMKYQESKQTFSRQFNGAGSRMMLRNGNGQFFRNSRAVTGEILSVDDKGMTVKLPDESSRIVLFSKKMSINKAQQATISDLKTGETVAVFGTDNSDGSVSAQNIQLNPLRRPRPAQ